MFLTRDEIAELTGYQRPSCMIRKLREYRVRFFVAADGYPRVARSEIETRNQTRQRQEPDFAALRTVERRM